MWVLDRTNRTPTKCLLSKDPKAQIPPALPKQPWLCLFSSYHLFSHPSLMFLPYFVTFKRGRNLKRWRLNALRVNKTALRSPPLPMCQSNIAEVDTVAWEKKQEKRQHSLTAHSWDPLPVSGWYCPTGLQSSNRRMSQHVRSGLTAWVYVAPRHLWAVCLPSEAQCEETC